MLRSRASLLASLAPRAGLASRVALALAPTLALIASAAPAAAFCRTTTVKTAADFNPTGGECFDEGVPLFWRNACVGYSLNRTGSRKVALDDAARIISQAFVKWTGATCPTDGSMRSRVSIDVRDLGPVDCASVELNQRGPNQNVIVFRDDDWKHPPTVLGLTTTTFVPGIGELINADMELNTTVKMAFRDPVPADEYDFDAVVTHEVGHFFGLAHSQDSLATMYANVDKALTRPRQLAADDINGICDIYRPDGVRTVLNDRYTAAPQCDPTPRRGFTRDCKEEDTGICEAGVAPGAHGSRATGTLATLGIAIAFAGLAGARRLRLRAPATPAAPRRERDAASLEARR